LSGPWRALVTVPPAVLQVGLEVARLAHPARARRGGAVRRRVAVGLPAIRTDRLNGNIARSAG
jgi:hypothetical protein